jgi:hypothetical protein
MNESEKSTLGVYCYTSKQVKERCDRRDCGYSTITISRGCGGVYRCGEYADKFTCTYMKSVLE